ncbi:MAG TPA: ATP-binding protein [Ktedonobacterales bacterium]|nr:ATP-binding protein [Ktedonobacterales bacterium]
MDNASFIREVLSRPPNVIAYSISQDLASLFPNKGIIQAEGYFDVESFAEAGLCQVTRKATPYAQALTHWIPPEPELYPGIYSGGDVVVVDGRVARGGSDEGEDIKRRDTVDRVTNAWLEVTWEDARLDVLILTWGEQNHYPRYWILAEQQDIARGFLAAVSRWNMEIRGEVLVFENGGWHKDEQLYRAVKSATFDTVILRGSLKQDIRDDVLRFFDARATYEEYNIPWKRGILFVGPPGNGKTLTVKALVSSLAQPCLYVKNFRAPHGVDEMCIRAVFDRARRTAPCIIVLEDLDAQLTPQNRSFFLNELDGFATNGGILTLATTNHPERLDPAVLDRPSRFDRKYPFDLPEQPERHAYLALWNDSLKPALQLTEDGVRSAGEQTEGFSFAYLKELCLASTMRWLVTAQPGAMNDVLLAQVSVLREQMASVPMPGDEPPAAEQPMPPGVVTGYAAYGRMMGRRSRFGPGM